MIPVYYALPLFIVSTLCCFALGIIVGLHCEPNAPDEEASE